MGKKNENKNESDEEIEMFESDQEENKSDDETSEDTTEDSLETSENSKSLTFIKLKDNSKTEMKYVYHISDVHIRNIQRHIEYKEVFEKTYRKLRTEIGDNNKISLIVLTGDIMHSKTELSPEAINLAYHFFKNLSEIATVILIPGNHDCNLSNKDRLDALSPIVDDIGKFDNLFYLKKSGIYQYYNIVFGFTSVFDDYFISSKKISTDIWRGIKQKNKFKIALYHGPVHGAKTDVGHRMNTGELVAEDFEGYNYVMLGDIHKYQYMDDDETIAYSGSLIQQSYGESLDGHGILKWNLLSGESKLLEIKNDYGFCTIEIRGGKIIESKIPRKPRIRIILENTTEIQCQDAIKKLETEYEVKEIVKESNFKTKFYNDANQKNLKNEISATFASQENTIRTYLKNNGHDKKVINNLICLHEKLYKKISKNRRGKMDIIDGATKNGRWKLLELKFSNTLCYGEGNVIDFRNYDQNKIIGIFAPNHYGKSAILDIILFCLFDKLSRGERRDILNKNEKKMYCSLLLGVGNETYLIERMGQLTKNRMSVKIDVNFYCLSRDKKGNEIQEKLNGIDRNDTNKKIVNLIGDYNDYLTTCFCLQYGGGRNTNFIDMTQQQKKEYLNEILKLKIFEDFHEIAKDKLKKLTTQMKDLEKNSFGKSLGDIKENIKTVSREIKCMQLEKKRLLEELSGELDRSIAVLSNNTLTNYHELSQYDLDNEENILEAINSTENKLKNKSNSNLSGIRKQLTEKKSVLAEINKKLGDVVEGDDVASLAANKEKLIKKLVNIPKKIRASELTSLTNEATLSGNRIKTIDKVLSNHKNKDLSEKIDRIDELKKIISNLRNSLKPMDEDSENKLLKLQTEHKENEKIIFETPADLFFGQTVNQEQKNKLSGYIGIKKKFITRIKNNIDILDQYVDGNDEQNNDVVSSSKNYNNRLIEKYQQWIDSTNKKIISADDKMDYSHVLKKSSKLTSELFGAANNYFMTVENNYIQQKIKKAEHELDLLSEFSGTKKEIDNLKQEKKLLQEKMQYLENSINEIDEYQKHIVSNEKLQEEITQLEKIIDKQKSKEKNLQKEKKDVEEKIAELEEIINNHKKEIEQNEKLRLHLKLLNEYYLQYLNWWQKNESLNRWKKIKKDFDEHIINLDKRTEKKEYELSIHKKDLEEYLAYRKKFDNKSEKINLYQTYVKLMNYDGLPYQLLKTYLPLIESDVNQILHSMVNFSIKFVFYEEDNTKKENENQRKTNLGCVDINICYRAMKPRRVQLACGLERFIIGLAIRMTLCQISLTAKPNFIIIDEGWSCMDSENRNNVSAIMNYIKTQYEHIIIISHLEELKNEADYVINIAINGKYSYIKESNKVSISRKQMKQRKHQKVITV